MSTNCPSAAANGGTQTPGTHALLSLNGKPAAEVGEDRNIINRTLGLITDGNDSSASASAEAAHQRACKQPPTPSSELRGLRRQPQQNHP
jgi:hypothetical protein